MKCALCAFVVCFLLTMSFGQKPVAELPRVYMDASWQEPVAGRKWAAHTAEQLSKALESSAPGDVIVLDAGATYVGNFKLPAKSNPSNKWIYIVSSAMAKLPEGHRVSPADAVNMPKVVTPNASQAFSFYSGASYIRLSGIEIYSASTYAPSGYTPGVKYGYALVGIANAWPPPLPVPDHIVFDRVYVHCDDTHDCQAALQVNFTYAAVVDSYVSDIHMKGTDTLAVGAFYTTGPIKIANNYLSAAGENIIFGGSGGNANPGVPSDIEIRNNYLFKPLSWVPLSVTNHTMVVKNAFELKSAQRVLFDGNVIENVWASGQLGTAIMLTVRSGQSGDFAVDNDITITNNVLKNVVSGIGVSAVDDTCGPAPGAYPNCHNAGSQDRINIANNLITFYDPTILGGNRNAGLTLQPSINRIAGTTPPTLGMIQDVIFQHNTIVTATSTPNPFAGIWFGAPSGYKAAPHLTSNVWILDNVFSKQPNGDGGITLAKAMPWPDPIAARFSGNVILAPGETVQPWPAHNYVSQKALTFDSRYQLITPDWSANTSDKKQAGYSAAGINVLPASNLSTGSQLQERDTPLGPR